MIEPDFVLVSSSGLPSQKSNLSLILASACLAHCQGFIEGVQELSCAGGRKPAVIRAAGRCAT
jgi:hypothetical protein